MIESIIKILNTFSEEIRRVVFQKCQELGLDINKGSIPLEEAFNNLFDVRDTLFDATNKKKINQLPLTVQKTILNNLETISLALNNLVNGADEIINIVDAVEVLYYNLYIFRFDNLSQEYLGYKSKENNLKYLLTQTEKLKRSLEEGLRSKNRLDKLISDLEELKDVSSKNVNESTEIIGKINQSLESATNTNQNVSAIYTNVQQIESNIKTHQANVTSSNAEVSTVEKRIKEFFTEIDQNRTKIETLGLDAKKTVDTNQAGTNILIGELKNLESQIKDQIEKATGYSLFHSFQKRQLDIASSKRIWS